jgi:pimeloyl-ACP methyl ester carboxylesterase
MRKLIFTIALTAISRFLLARDRILGYVERDPKVDSTIASVTRLRIPSGRNLLNAVLVKPASRPTRAVVLICHGIGEIVEHWTAPQQLLAAGGIASLVFDYSGYGRSSGFIAANQCEDDAIAAFTHLQKLLPDFPISVLGFSLGSGIAGAILQRVPMHSLVLCAAFTSFKAATLRLGFPKPLAFVILDTWRTEEALRDCKVPLLIVHGQQDQLFPVQMAVDLKNACSAQTELVVVPNLSHDAVYYQPKPYYWNRIVARFLLEPS